MNTAKRVDPLQDATPPSPYHDRQFLHTYSAGAFLPLIQASITGAMCALGLATLLYAFDAVDILKPALIGGVIAWVLTWLYLQRRWLNLTVLEQTLKVDINGDGRIGEAQAERRETVIRIDEAKRDGHFQSSTYRFPIAEEALRTMAQGLLAGRPFSEREWAGFGKLLSSGEWRKFIHVLKSRELAQYVSDKDPRQGVELTERGWAMMEELAPDFARAEVVEEGE